MRQQMKTLVLHPGTQHSRQTALALQELGRLAFLATGLFDHPDSLPHRFAAHAPGKAGRFLQRELSRFASPGLDPALVRAMPQFELPERIATRAGAVELGRRIDALLNRHFGKRVADMAAREGPFVLWGYDGSAFAAFADPRTNGMPKILDRTIADWRYWTEEIERIAETHGDWLQRDAPGWNEERVARNDTEYAQADRIVCGSPFVVETITSYSSVPDLADKLVLLPYTYDAALFSNAPAPARISPNEPVRFLFAGQLSARKGVQHVLEAIRSLPREDATLTLGGPVMVPERVLAPYRDRVDILGPVTRAEMPAIMHRHHALVLPSHFEGSAIVMIEAMASGLAIIQSAAAGLGASEESGFVMPRPDAERVEEAMCRLIADRDLLQSMRCVAMEEAKGRDFAAYRRGIAAVLADLGL